MTRELITTEWRTNFNPSYSASYSDPVGTLPGQVYGNFSGTVVSSPNGVGTVDYNFHFDSIYECRFEFPTELLGTRLTGTWCVPLQLSFTPTFTVMGSDLQIRDYDYSNFSALFEDNSSRVSLNMGSNNILNGCTATLTNRSGQGTSTWYNLVLTFDDFLLPANYYSDYFTINLDFSYDGTFYDYSPSSWSIVYLCNAWFDTKLVPTVAYDTQCISVSLPQFAYSNDYYTILQALNNANFGISNLASESSVSSIASTCAAINTLLSNWHSLSVQDLQSIDFNINGFSNFSNSVLSYLGTIATASSATAVSTAAMALDSSDISTAISSVLASFLTLLDSTDQLEQYLADIYNTLSGSNNFNLLRLWPYSNVKSLICALVPAITGITSNTEFFTVSSISQSTFNRWVSIIQTAISNILSGGGDLSIEASMAADEVDFLHESYEAVLWSDVADRLEVLEGFDYLPEASVNSTAIWFVGLVEDVWSNLGAFSYVISVSLFTGFIILIIGALNHFHYHGSGGGGGSSRKSPYTNTDPFTGEDI